MKRRLLYLAAIYAGLLAIFMLAKPLFMAFQGGGMLAGVSFADWFRVMAHGLKLDVTVAGYAAVVPWLTVVVSVWVKGGKWPARTSRIYFLFVSLFLAAVFVGNTILYRFWKFPLDTTPLFYLRNPGDAVASVPVWFTIAGLVGVALIWALLYWGFSRLTRLIDDVRPVLNRGWWSVVMAVAGGLLFLGIRGGAAQSTANVGRVYFSDNIFLNHAAVNPAFSFLESLTREKDLAAGYRFFDGDRRAAIFDSLKAPEPDSTAQVLRTDRPDVLIILLESFSMNVLAENIGGEPVTPRFNELVGEGIWFPEFYANSFRTDRGLVSVLNGYPAQPATSIMKYPAKSQTLPSIAAALREAGYSTEILYGGDIDFTNMRSFFYASGYETVTGKDGLRPGGEKTKWGYDDCVMFGELLHRLKSREPGGRSFTTFLTLSSHEPFAVPFERYGDPVLNAMAFTDDCLGRFIDELRRTPMWENLLVVLVADHAMTYPPSLAHYEIARHHIPMLWIGGAVAGPLTVEGPWSQSDIASTLLRQLGLDDSEFVFSRNIFNPDQEPMAFFTFNNGFGFMDSTGATVWDADAEKALILMGEEGAAEREARGKAILQTLMEDMQRR